MRIIVGNISWSTLERLHLFAIALVAPTDQLYKKTPPLEAFETLMVRGLRPIERPKEITAMDKRELARVGPEQLVLLSSERLQFLFECHHPPD